jgi:hypothetical protein
MRLLMVALACGACAAPPQVRPPEALRGFQVHVHRDSALFRYPMPAFLWAAAGEKSGSELTWLATWDSVEIVGADRRCCGVAASIVTDTTSDPNPQTLLPRARRSQLWTEPAGSITAVVLSPEDSLLLRYEQGTLVLRLGRSTVLAQLQRLRPAQVLLEAKLWAADTTYEQSVAPLYAQ